jgi:hypothetical protein
MEENQGTPVSGEVNEPQKTFTQDEVNKLIGREKAKAAEHATRATEERLSARQAESANAGMQQESRMTPPPNQVSADQITQQVMQQLQKDFQEKQLKSQMEQVANNYLSKVADAKKNYQDFDDITKDFDPTAFPQLTFLLSGIENGGDVLYDLSKNPGKLANIDLLAQRSPRMAQSQLQSLSKSISDNKQAQSEAQGQQIPDPLDRLSPTRVLSNNGKMSISEMRKQPWLRG